MWPSVEPTGPINEQLTKLISDLTTDAGNVRGLSGAELLNGFRDYVDAASRSLRPQLRYEDIDRLFRTRTFWATFDIPGGFPQVQQLVRGELEALSNQLTALGREFGEFQRRWEGPVRLVVVDTSVLVENEKTFDYIDWYAAVDQPPDRPIRLVLPLVVIDQLDNLKMRASPETKKTRVRSTLRRLEELLAGGDRASLPSGHAPIGAQVTVEVIPDPRRHERLSDPDAEILDRAHALQTLSGQWVTVATEDTGMLMRARLAGLIGIRVAPIPE